MDPLSRVNKSNMIYILQVVYQARKLGECYRSEKAKFIKAVKKTYLSNKVEKIFDVE